MTGGEMDALIAGLTGARREVEQVLLLCGRFVDNRAASGDPVAAALSRRLASAFDRLTAENVAAVTALRDHRPDATA
ncbi:hypothetical protein E9529_15770 [Blastococcus sp. KM273128]|uniref:hypothetical protein n=1 Tax=Blastococcus sp. KM273128 TaxID=2570314 RepID=UPI001F25D18D|nr:hypothetical protein [Blastococcus sp. KM273128]MCF6745704.1 hypothetical protein [Blastococcus sp. KM273128]